MHEYLGTGGTQKLFGYIESFEVFLSNAENLPQQAEVTLAASKFNGDAIMWWREHKINNPTESGKRIRTWEQLKNGLIQAFAPPEHARAIRDKLRTIKQKGTISEYNAAFSKLTAQLPNVTYEEAEYDYLQGLKPEIRALLRTKDLHGELISDIRTLMNACLKLDSHEPRSKRDDEAHYTGTSNNTLNHAET